jgi:hypothetical protein
MRREPGSIRLIKVTTCSTWSIDAHNEMQLKPVLRDLRDTVCKRSPRSTTYQQGQMIGGLPYSPIAQIIVHRVDPLHNVVRVDPYVQLSGNPSNESWRELEDLVCPGFRLHCTLTLHCDFGFDFMLSINFFSSSNESISWKDIEW